MVTISLASNKGGVGKTTSSVGIAKALARMDYKVLLIDLDPQGDAGRFLSYYGNGDDSEEVEKYTISEAIYFTVAGLPFSVSDWYRQISDNLYLLPASELLNSAPSIIGNGEENKLILRRIIEQIERDKFDFVLIDNQHGINLLVNNALYASDYVIIPLDGDITSYDDLPAMINHLENDTKRTNPQFNLLGILLNMQKRNNYSRDIRVTVNEEWKDLVFPVVFNDKPKQAQDLVLSKPNEFDADYDRLARDIAKRVGLLKEE